MERTDEQIKEHYELEKMLADKLRNSSKSERKTLYSEVYNELFSKIKHHPQLTRKKSVEETREDTQRQLNFLRKFLSENQTYLEVGAGDCSLTFEVAKIVKKALAVDVSEVISENSQIPENFKLILSDGSSIPVQPKSVNIAYSNQLMEHLHVNDAFEQLKNIYKALVKGGSYICVTPNRLNGPHDISAYFDRVATGFHMKEYTYYELKKIFRKAGFSKIRAYSGKNSSFFVTPIWFITSYERLLELIPYTIRKIILSIKLFKFILFIRLEGIKN